MVKNSGVPRMPYEIVIARDSGRCISFGIRGTPRPYNYIINYSCYKLLIINYVGIGIIV